jgi:hypothetical protein
VVSVESIGAVAATHMHMPGTFALPGIVWLPTARRSSQPTQSQDPLLKLKGWKFPNMHLKGKIRALK